MNWLSRLFGGGSSKSSTRYCFICSGNASLIESLIDVFRSHAPEVPVRQYDVDTATLWSAKEDAQARDLSFAGLRFMGRQEEPVGPLADVLGAMSAGASHELHIPFAPVEGEMWTRMQLVYNEVLSQAVMQGIFPFPMFVTTSDEAQKALIELFETVRTT